MAGPDSVLVELAGRGALHRVVVDTAPFRGSAPESVTLEIADARGRDVASLGDTDFVEILPRTRLLGDTVHEIEDELRPHAPGTHVRLRVWPDGAWVGSASSARCPPTAPKPTVCAT
jgi:allantoicase